MEGWTGFCKWRWGEEFSGQRELHTKTEDPERTELVVGGPLSIWKRTGNEAGTAEEHLLQRWVLFQRPWESQWKSLSEGWHIESSVLNWSASSIVGWLGCQHSPLHNCLHFCKQPWHVRPLTVCICLCDDLISVYILHQTVQAPWGQGMSPFLLPLHH